MRRFRLSKLARFVAGPLVAVVVTATAGAMVVQLGAVTEIASTPFEVVVVNAADADGAATARPLQAGTTYVLEASGTFQHGKGEADAECATVPGDQRWLRGPYPSFGEHFIDLLVGGAGVEWTPTSADVNNCNTTNHRYEYTLVPTSTGPLTLRVNDAVFTDNVGALTVTITEHSDSDPVGDAEEDAQAAQAEAQRTLDDTTETVEQTKAQTEAEVAQRRAEAEAEAQRLRAQAEEDAKQAQDEAEAEAQRLRAQAEEAAKQAEDDAKRAQAEAEAEAARRRAEAEAVAGDAQREVEAIVGDVAPGPVAEAVLGAIAELQAEADAALDAVQESDVPAPDPEPDPAPDPEPDPNPAPDPDPTPEPEPDPEPEPSPQPETKSDAGHSDPDPDDGASGHPASGPGEAQQTAVSDASTPPARSSAPTDATSASSGSAAASSDGEPAGGTSGTLPADLFAFELPASDEVDDGGRRAAGTLGLPAPPESRLPVIVTLVLVVGFTLAMAVRTFSGARLARTRHSQRYR